MKILILFLFIYLPLFTLGQATASFSASATILEPGSMDYEPAIGLSVINEIDSNMGPFTPGIINLDPLKIDAGKIYIQTLTGFKLDGFSANSWRIKPDTGVIAFNQNIPVVIKDFSSTLESPKDFPETQILKIKGSVLFPLKAEEGFYKSINTMEIIIDYN